MNFRNLFMARANPTIKDNEDRTPIHLAAERGHTATVEFLAEKFKVQTLYENIFTYRPMELPFSGQCLRSSSRWKHLDAFGSSPRSLRHGHGAFQERSSTSNAK